jgi:hypothetical protein
VCVKEGQNSEKRKPKERDLLGEKKIKGKRGEILRKITI